MCIRKKWAHDGRRTLFNQGQIEIKWQKTDAEGSLMKDHGVLCAIYDRALLNDPRALQALMREDNQKRDHLDGRRHHGSL